MVFMINFFVEAVIVVLIMVMSLLEEVKVDVRNLVLFVRVALGVEHKDSRVANGRPLVLPILAIVLDSVLRIDLLLLVVSFLGSNVLLLLFPESLAIVFVLFLQVLALLAASLSSVLANLLLILFEFFPLFLVICPHFLDLFLVGLSEISQLLYFLSSHLSLGCFAALLELFLGEALSCTVSTPVTEFVILSVEFVDLFVIGELLVITSMGCWVEVVQLAVVCELLFQPRSVLLCQLVGVLAELVKLLFRLVSSFAVYKRLFVEVLSLDTLWSLELVAVLVSSRDALPVFTD